MSSSLAQAAAAAFLVLLAALHLIQPELDPSWRVISEYPLGRLGWLMSLAFLTLAVACGALAAALRPLVSTRVGGLGLVLLLASALGFGLAAAFPTDPVTTPQGQATTAGGMHAAGAALGGLVPIAAIFVALGGPAGMRRSLWLATAAAWLGEIVFIGAMATMLPEDGRLGPSVLIGWPNRLMIVGYCAWLLLTARLVARTGVGGPNPGMAGRRAAG